MLSNEARLFGAAAMRVVVDAVDTRNLNPCDFYGESPEDAREQHKLWQAARDRIERRCPDFMAFCDYAGLNGEIMRDAVLDGRMTYPLALKLLRRFSH